MKKKFNCLKIMIFSTLLFSSSYVFAAGNECYIAYSEGNYSKAMDICTQQSKTDAEAALRVGWMYLEGKGSISKDPNKSFPFLLAAEKLGAKNSSYAIDMYCMRNEGSRADILTACEKLKKHAYTDHNLLSESALAAVLIRGQPFPQDIDEATRLFELGASRNYSISMFILGIMSQSPGLPQPVNYIQSYVWLKLAEKFQNIQPAGIDGEIAEAFIQNSKKQMEDNAKYVHVAEQHLSDADLVKAKKLIAEWDPYEYAVGKHFAAHQIYPESPTVKPSSQPYILKLRLDREGRLLSYQIEEKSGRTHDIYFDTIKDILEKAAPFPKVPADYKPEQKELEFKLNVKFTP